MKCPVDNTDLSMTERQSVEIDYCPQCRGVWLDRGELDKIIEKTESGPGAQAAAPQPDPPEYQQGYGKHGGGYGKHGGYGYGKKRRKGMLGELFDF